jgi:hypothetical protein
MVDGIVVVNAQVVTPPSRIPLDKALDSIGNRLRPLILQAGRR